MLASGYVELPSLAECEAEWARRSLRHYIRQAWGLTDPAPFVWAWYIDAIADHLEAVHRRDIKRLVINFPYRHGKSKICGVCYPTWAWLDRPAECFLTASYDYDLAVRDSWASRLLINTPWYERLNRDDQGRPIFRLADDQNVKSRYVNNHHGHRIAVSVSGASTGEGGSVLMIDDPTGVDQAKSETERQRANDWYDTQFSTRKNDPKTAAVVIIQQRLHALDLSGHVLSKELGFEALVLRTRFEIEDARRKTSIGWKDPRTTEGELLNPARFPEDVLKLEEEALGPDGFAAQHQQRPVRAGGNIIKTEWLRERWYSLPQRFDAVMQSWDCAFKGKEEGKTAEQTKRSWVVGTCWGFVGPKAYLLDLARGHWDFFETCEQIRAMSKRWPDALRKVVEEKANGSAVISSLERELPGIEGVDPRGSKPARLSSVAPLFAAGNVLLPPDNAYPWVREYVAELTGFPNYGADDQVDSTSQALIDRYLPEPGNSEATKAARTRAFIASM